jgi:hypothetical protein
VATLPDAGDLVSSRAMVDGWQRNADDMTLEILATAAQRPWTTDASSCATEVTPSSCMTRSSSAV